MILLINANEDSLISAISKCTVNVTSYIIIYRPTGYNIFGIHIISQIYMLTCYYL